MKQFPLRKGLLPEGVARLRRLNFRQMSELNMLKFSGAILNPVLKLNLFRILYPAVQKKSGSNAAF